MFIITLIKMTHYEEHEEQDEEECTRVHVIERKSSSEMQCIVAEKDAAAAAVFSNKPSRSCVLRRS